MERIVYFSVFKIIVLILKIINNVLFVILFQLQIHINQLIRKKEAKDSGEVTATTFKEGQAKHINMTGGGYISGEEIEIIGNILSEIRKQTGMERIPGLISPAPAKEDNIQ